MTKAQPQTRSGRRVIRGFMTDGAPSVRERRFRRASDEEGEAPPEGAVEAFWPKDSYGVRIDGDALAIFERSEASGAERQVKTYPAAAYGSTEVGDNIVIRRRSTDAKPRQAVDREVEAIKLRGKRLAAQAQLQTLQDRNVQRRQTVWGKGR